MSEPMMQEPTRPGADPEPQYSNINLNHNRRATVSNDLPNWTGTANLRVENEHGIMQNIEYRIAAWGPNASMSGGPNNFQLRITPSDPTRHAQLVSAVRAARKFEGREPSVTPVNPIDGFEVRDLGTGALFTRNKEEVDAGMADDPNKRVPAALWGWALVDLPQGPTNLALSLWAQKPGISKKNGQRYEAFYSGTLKVHDPAEAARAKLAKAGNGARPEPR